jgi:hypothetical protein
MVTSLGSPDRGDKRAQFAAKHLPFDLVQAAILNKLLTLIF